MKWYISDQNGVLNDLKTRLAGHLATPRDADVWITWQDVRGSYADLIKTSKELGFGKPTFCVQHGRSASKDYGPPNSFKGFADYFLCWGKSDYERMLSLGMGDKTRIVGCPLNSHIKPKVEHKEKVILFVPISTGKEEPENIATYYELMRLKYEKAQAKVLENRDNLKDHWGFDGRNNVLFSDLSNHFDVVTKLLPWHDKSLYHGNIVMGFQDMPKNNEINFNLIRNVDLVVGLDEGTTEVFAYGHNVPVVIVDGFKHRETKKDGTYYQYDTYRTKAAAHCELKDLGKTVDHFLKYPDDLIQERAEVAEAELGLSFGDATENIIKVVKDCVRVRAQVPVER